MKTLTIEERKSISPQLVLELLMKGNQRFINNLSLNKDHLKILSEFSNEQKPVALILSCIDSRAPVEIIFDQGIGDLFSARVAGNVLNEDIIASIEFAVKMVEVKLVMVLGHTNCGAVSACINQIKDGHLKYLVNKIEPVYLKYKSEIDSENKPVDKLAEYNVLEVAYELFNRSDVIRNFLEQKKIKLITAMYQLDTGKVSLIKEIDTV